MNEFQFFDPDAEITINSGHLPHWQQSGATYFITYRTNDSISAVALKKILRSRDDWLLRRGIDASVSNWCHQLAKLPLADRRSFQKMFATVFENQLDLLSGECLLRRPDLAKIVVDSLHHFDGQRYRLGGFVVMPNHVHVLACVFAKYTMLDVCYSWKHFQARMIHDLLKRSGSFFQSESFDHLVRDEDHFEKFRRYIETNPTKANLSEGEYALYMPDLPRSPGSP